MTTNEIGREAQEINEGNGWEVFHRADWPADMEPVTNPEATNDRARVRFLCTHMALVHSEVSEATEAIRHRDRENFDEELADVVIRVASIAHGLGTDLDAAIRDKLDKNRNRGLHHGGKAV
jgi:NTP pyrophosphatase (non-canonical NTP hydrolase)